ncbi:unnamed protein product, partial [Effrenium voratum]
MTALDNCLYAQTIFRTTEFNMSRKAKARHVMKGFSEDGAEQLEAATPQVTRENQTGDYWEETETSWIRHHVTPRRTLFHPGMSSGPDLHQISPQRQIKIDNQDQVIND